MSNKHTYEWYITHDFLPGGSEYESLDDSLNAPSKKTMRKNFDDLGVLHLVPDLDNFRPLVEMYTSWYTTKVKESWANFTKEEKGPLVTLHWTLGTIVEDPTTDPEILHYVYRRHLDQYVVDLLNNISCPESILTDVISLSGTKDDPMSDSRGGEVALFAIHNPYLPSHLVDLCARKMKKATNQNRVVDHPNVTRDTLAYLLNSTKYASVKKSILLKMNESGFLKV